MIKRPQNPVFPTPSSVPDDKTMQAEFIQRIVAQTEKILKSGSVSVSAARNELKKLRADFVARGSDEQALRPIDDFLQKFPE